MTKSRNRESVFKDFYSWYFKDWMVSGARARLSVPARGIYQDLLGLCYTEGGIDNDADALMQRLAIPEQYRRDLEAAIGEFDADDSGRLMHPRVQREVVRLEGIKTRQSEGARARWARTRTTKPAPKNAAADGEPW